jgi:(R,R)-butanediol dehydrogenase/meso-butanediol dehydrogenase/diacetyl reductase
MKQGVLVGKRKVIVDYNCPMPKVEKENDVIIRVRYCGVNNDDYNAFIGNLGRIYKDRRLFHEISGEIYDMGNMARSMGFAIGDRVTRNVLSGCGYCPMCRRGLFNLCTELDAPGGSAEYILCDAKSLVKLPDDVSLEEGCLYWLAATCIRCVEKLQINPGSNVIILGGGATGLMLLQVVKKRMPSTVIIVEPVESKRKTAISLGADIVIDPVNESIDEKILELTFGMGFDVVIDASGSCASQQNITDMLARGGKLMLFSNYRIDEYMNINLMEMYWKEYTIYSSFGATQGYYTGIETSIFNSLDIRSIIDQILPLEEINRALYMYGTERYKRILVKI